MSNNQNQAAQAATQGASIEAERATGELIAAAEKHAEAYEGDDRECIKTDVINAFYQGAAWQAARRTQAATTGELPPLPKAQCLLPGVFAYRENDMLNYARAAIEAYRAQRQVAPASAQPADRCPHCDDTGDVHTPTGEWRGACSCPAGAQPDQRECAAVPEGAMEVGRRMAAWLYGLSKSALPFQSWAEKCKRLSDEWDQVAASQASLPDLNQEGEQPTINKGESA